MEEHQHEPESGEKGGMAEAYVGPTAHPVAVETARVAGLVRWGTVFTGALIAFGISVLLTFLGAGFGFGIDPSGLGGGLAYWMVGSGVVGLFVGGMLAIRAARITNTGTAVLHGAVIWSMFVLLDVSGFFSSFASLFGVTGVAEEAALTLTIAASWWVFVAYVLAFAAVAIGCAAGVASEEEHTEAHH